MTEKYKITKANAHEKKANWDHKYRHQNFSVDIDVWYPMLESITFKSFFIPIRHREAEAILDYYSLRNLGKNDIFTKEDTDVLLNLEKRIDNYFQSKEELKNGAMFRLSGRSGKDSDYYDNEKIMKDYAENLEKISKKLKKNKNDFNTRYVAIATLMNRFHVKCGKDVLNILLTSQRLFLDLKDWLTHGGKEQIVLRQWEERLSTEREFRAFVQNNELKAICQDERYGTYLESIQNRLLYEKLINDYFNTKVKPLMKIPNYIVDFCIIDNKVKLIEFSPFLRCTSACLFRWDVNYDEMLHGNGKLTVREEEHKEIQFFVEEWEEWQRRPSIHFDDYYIYDTYCESFVRYLNYLNPMNILHYSFNNIGTERDNKIKRIFVVSVLKHGFYWNKKYISYDDNKNELVGKGIFYDHSISIDKNGFGWIVKKDKKNKKQCFGEIYDISYEDFIDIEYFYSQGDSKMEEITVKILKEDNKLYLETKAFCFILNDLPEGIKQKEESVEVEEYSLKHQNEFFNPMQHIINQQERYLNMSLDFDLKDSW